MLSAASNADTNPTPPADILATTELTYQVIRWLKETRRDGHTSQFEKISERNSALLQELDEILTKYEPN
jgi:hypothetical protein